MPDSLTNTVEGNLDARSQARLAVLALSRGGSELGRRLAADLDGEFFACKGRLGTVMAEIWPEFSRIICIMATGIVVRTIAPLLHDKYSDPAIVVCDELGRFAISLISGHLGGANALARQVAAVTRGQAVLTTASDVLGKTALDLWCRDQGLVPVDREGLTRAMGKLVDRGSLRLWSRYPLGKLPEDLLPVGERKDADLIIDCRTDTNDRGTLAVPRALVVGIGCNRGTPAAVIARAVQQTCEQQHLHPMAIARLASIDLKQDEVGLLEYAAECGLHIDFYSKDQLNRVDNVGTSEAVLRATGAKGVAEPAALISAGVGARLLVPKMKWVDATTAVAEMADPLTTTSQGQERQ